MSIHKSLSHYAGGFVLAGFLNKSGLPFPVVCGASILVLGFLGMRGGSFFLVGVFWAYFHHPLEPLRAVAGASLEVGFSEKVAIQHGYRGLNHIFVRGLDSGRRYLAHGNGMPGQLGEVRCWYGSCRFSGTQEDSLRHVKLEWIKKRLAATPQPAFGWLVGILLGDKSYLMPQTAAAFKNTGLFHLLVMSGLHVSFFAVCLETLLLFPCRVAYVLGWVGPVEWSRLKTMAVFVVIFSLAFLLAWTNFQIPVQRAFFLYVVFALHKKWLGTVPPLQGAVWGFTAQSILFPYDLVSMSALMSWGTYMIIVQSREKAGGVWGLIQMQLKVSFLMMLCLGQFSVTWALWSLVANYFFPALMLTSVVIFGLSDLGVVSYLVDIHDIFLTSVSLVAGLVGNPHRLSWHIHVALGFVGFILFYFELVQTEDDTRR